MDTQQSLEYGNASLAVSVIMGVFAFISSQNVIDLVKGAAALISVIAGVMAIRYYHYATKEKKQALKKSNL